MCGLFVLPGRQLWARCFLVGLLALGLAERHPIEDSGKFHEIIHVRTDGLGTALHGGYGVTLVLAEAVDALRCKILGYT